MPGSSLPGSITLSHPLPTLLKSEQLVLTNSFWMPREVRRSVDDELSAYYTGKNDLTRRVTHREAVFETVIQSIFDAWHYDVL
jgi:hypothetical protein